MPTLNADRPSNPDADARPAAATGATGSGASPLTPAAPLPGATGRSTLASAATAVPVAATAIPAAAVPVAATAIPAAAVPIAAAALPAATLAMAAIAAASAAATEPTPGPRGLDDLYDISRLARRLGVEHATIRVWLSRRVPWLPQPDGRLNGGAVWRASTLEGIEERRTPGRPGRKPSFVPSPGSADVPRTNPAPSAASLASTYAPEPPTA